MTQTPSDSSKHALPKVAVAHGDGIGPEIMDASLRILRAAGAKFEELPLELGEAAYLAGHTSGITPEAWDILGRADVLFKGPITTPLGSGYKSLNVTLRKTLGLFANIRPCRALAPAIPTRHPNMDLVVIRENEEDLYAGIEHRQTQDVYQCLKLLSRPGSERIIRYAFEYARTRSRKRVTCFSKSNIMKLTDGMFQQVFNEIAAEYPDIEHDHMIIDIGTARLADAPESFDVIVTLNLYGDIISDVAAELTGSVGLGASANIGETLSMFEAIHGSAPDIAGKGIGNPSGLLLAGVKMLVHLGQGNVAAKVHNAWLRTIEDGQVTGDLLDNANGISDSKALGTQDFADAVIARLGQSPNRLAAVDYGSDLPRIPTAPPPTAKDAKRELVGVDVFVMSRAAPDALGEQLQNVACDGVELTMITNRGVKVWPNGHPATFCTDHWRCRFKPIDGKTLSRTTIVDLLSSLNEAGMDFIKTEQLFDFDGEPAYSLGQGQ